MKRKRCTICGKKFELHDMFAALCFEKQIGYGSVHDGETFNLNLCCDCFDKFADILNLICKKNIFE
ncbi:MAG: hypothetical protein IIX54_02870 [Clostridia bacterium]|nr:hypothetical protein [Clostridia bacterium]